jgi:hypothetical protein
VEHTTHADTHGRTEVELVHRFGAIMEDGNGGYVPVKITVIQYIDPKSGTRLYAIEAVDVEKIKSAGQMSTPSSLETPDPIADFDKRLVQLAEKVNSDMDVSAAEYEAARWADQVVRDCQPGSVEGDQMPLLQELKKNPLGAALAAFQTPMAVIFQNLFIDAPNDFKQGRVLHGLWTYALYAGLAAVTALLFEGAGGGDDDDKPAAANIGLAAALGLVESMPVIGGDLAFQIENFYRSGKFRSSSNGAAPALDSLMRAANAASSGKWAKALLTSTDALFYLTGLPAGLKREIEKSFERGDLTPLLGNKREKE